MKTETPVTTTRRRCPKCGGKTALGPRYCQADDKFAVPRLLFKCKSCGFLSADPTADATEEEQRIVMETNARLTAFRRGPRTDGAQPVDNRSREIREIFGAETRRRR